MAEADPHAFVGRGGLKLLHALQSFGVSPEGLSCADLGCNVGGFTDCLLVHGARLVYAVDTAYGTLAWTLRQDPRVVVLERTNALHVQPPERVGLVVIDLGWTVQARAIPAALPWLKPQGRIITLIKPHYEALGGERSGLSRGVLDDSTAEQVARREPELVCLGGDLIERRPEQVLLLGKALSLLQPPLGIFAVPGNHEYDVDSDLVLWRHTLEEHGVEILINQGRRLMHNDESLWLAGVDDLSLGRPDLACALRGAAEDEPILLLSHHPDFFYEASRAGVDLTLSGHTHGGQITFFGRTPLRHTQLGYWRGTFSEDGAQLYVGRGVGTTKLPLRLNTPGEVAMIRLLTED